MDLMESWPIILCALQIGLYFILGVLFVFLNEFPRKELQEEHKEVDEYSAKVTEKPTVLKEETWEAWAGSISPGWLLALRIVAFLYLSGLLLDVYMDRNSLLEVYYFYTEWTLTLLIIYFGFASVVSIVEYERSLDEHRITSHDVERGDLHANLLHRNSVQGDVRSKVLESDPYASNKRGKTKAGYLGYALQILFQTVAPAVVLTDVVYWTFLYPFFPDSFPHTFWEWNLHAVNAVFLIVEILLNSMRFPWFRAAYFFIWGCIYCLFQWAIHALHLVDAPWPYPFMEVSTADAPLWYLAVGILHISAYAVVAFLNRLKLILQDRDSGMSSKARVWSLVRSLWPGGVA